MTSIIEQRTKSDEDFIVSVHVPKCAGTSLRHWLATGYGEKSIYWDYKDLPMDPSSPVNIDPEGFLSKFMANHDEVHGMRIVHGHFWARKYNCFDRAQYITFLRDPIERTLSNYFYWMQVPRSTNKLHNYVQDYQLSWLEFASLPVIRKVYSQVFFREFNMSRLIFIGDSARLNQEIDRLGKLLGFTHQIGHQNATGGNYQSKSRDILSESKNVKLLKSLLATDIDFYEKYAGR